MEVLACLTSESDARSRPFGGRKILGAWIEPISPHFLLRISEWANRKGMGIEATCDGIVPPQKLDDACPSAG